MISSWHTNYLVIAMPPPKKKARGRKLTEREKVFILRDAIINLGGGAWVCNLYLKSGLVTCIWCVN